MNILKSASKLVFVILAVGALVLTAMRIMDVKDLVVLTSMAFSYYFSKPGSSQPQD